MLWIVLTDESRLPPTRSHDTVEEVVYEDIDMDLDDSDFEPGADRELLGLFFPEVSLLQ